MAALDGAPDDGQRPFVDLGGARHFAGRRIGEAVQADQFTVRQPTRSISAKQLHRYTISG